MSEARNTRTETYENVKNDPLYQTWTSAQKLHLRVCNKYVDAFQEEVEKAKVLIREKLKPNLGAELILAAEQVILAYEAYAKVFKEQPPMEQSCPKE